MRFVSVVEFLFESWDNILFYYENVPESAFCNYSYWL